MSMTIIIVIIIMIMIFFPCSDRAPQCASATGAGGEINATNLYAIHLAGDDADGADADDGDSDDNVGDDYGFATAVNEDKHEWW